MAEDLVDITSAADRYRRFLKLPLVQDSHDTDRFSSIRYQQGGCPVPACVFIDGHEVKGIRAFEVQKFFNDVFKVTITLITDRVEMI